MSNYDVVAVFGYPIKSPGNILQKRLRAAQKLAEQNGIPIIVSGAGRLQQNESVYMAQWLLNHEFSGVIIKEPKARDTIENAVFTQSICDKKKYNHVVVVTSWFHAIRSFIILKLFMKNACIRPVSGGSIQLFFNDLKFIPSIKSSARKRGFL